MIDFHVHTLLSDGVLVPSEVVARAKAMGYEALAITDHVDESNLEDTIKKTLRFTENVGKNNMRVIAGVELTHIPPKDIERLTRKARELGAKLIVCHGETIVEPVEPGTNLAAIEAGVDILAHPGLVGEKECALARKNSVLFEITTRRGHCLANGHVASMAKRLGVGLILNTDSHEPSDLATDDYALKVALGAGLTKGDYEKIRENSRTLLQKVLSL